MRRADTNLRARASKYSRSLKYRYPLLCEHNLRRPNENVLSTIMDKSLGTLLRFWGVFQFIQVQTLPSRHKQCWTRVSRIFSEFLLCIGWGGGGGGGRRSARKFGKWCTVLRGNREMKEKYAHCSTVPRPFVQNCLNPGFGEKKVSFLHFSYAF